MEITGVNEAAQFINVTVNGVSTVFKLSGSFLNWNINKLEQISKFLFALVQHKKDSLRPGEMSYKNFIDNCEKHKVSIKTYRADDNLQDNIVKILNDNKVPYCIYPDLNSKDGKFEFSIPEKYKFLMEKYGQTVNIVSGENQHIALEEWSIEQMYNNADLEALNDIQKATYDELKTRAESPKYNGWNKGEEKEFEELSAKMNEFTNKHQSYGAVIQLNDGKMASSAYTNYNSGVQENPYFEGANNLDTLEKYLKENKIDYVVLPYDSNGRTSVLIDGKEYGKVTNNGAIYKDHIISVATYLDRQDENYKNSYFNQIYGQRMEKYARNGICDEVFKKADKNSFEEIIIPKQDMRSKELNDDEMVAIERKDDYSVWLNLTNEKGEHYQVSVEKERLRDNGEYYSFLAFKNEMFFKKDGYENAFGRNLNKDYSNRYKVFVQQGGEIKPVAKLGDKHFENYQKVVEQAKENMKQVAEAAASVVNVNDRRVRR